MSARLADIRGDVLYETDAAYLFRAHDATDGVWLPKSRCQWDVDDKTMTIEEWLAEDKGLL